MPFNLLHTLRQIPPKTLRAFLESRGLAASEDVWAEKDSRKQARRLCELLLIPETAADTLSDLIRTDQLANDRGERAIFSAAQDKVATALAFKDLQNSNDRALWFLSEHPDQFREAESLYFIDSHYEGQLCRHFNGPGGRTLSQAKKDVEAFKVDVCDYFSHIDGSGGSASVEFVDHSGDPSVHVALFIEGLPDNVIEIKNGTYLRRVSTPAVHVIVLYDTETGKVATIIKGGKPAHAMLKTTFCKHLLKEDASLTQVVPNPFQLSRIAGQAPLAPIADSGIDRVRVCSLYLAPLNGVGTFSIDVPVDDEMSAFDALDRWLREGSHVLKKFKVISATLALRLLPQADRRRTRTIKVKLTLPNTSNLRNLGTEERKMVEAHLAKWKLV